MRGQRFDSGFGAAPVRLQHRQGRSFERLAESSGAHQCADLERDGSVEDVVVGDRLGLRLHGECILQCGFRIPEQQMGATEADPSVGRVEVHLQCEAVHSLRLDRIPSP